MGWCSKCPNSTGASDPNSLESYGPPPERRPSASLRKGLRAFRKRCGKTRWKSCKIDPPVFARNMIVYFPGITSHWVPSLANSLERQQAVVTLWPTVTWIMKYLPGSSFRGVEWMIRGPYTPSLRVQTVPFGRCWCLFINILTSWLITILQH